jgi:hypothetical protein
MQTITVTVDPPIGRLISYASRSRSISPQRAAADLLALGFKTFLSERYRRYRRGEISFGRLAEELGMTTWELSDLLEAQGWPASNLPAMAWAPAESERQPARVAEDGVTYDVNDAPMLPEE